MRQFRLDNQRTILTYSFKRLSPLTIDFKSTKYTLGWAINSVEECYLHTVEVTGSNPVSPTTLQRKIERILIAPLMIPRGGALINYQL